MKILISALGILAITSSAMALTFFEDFEDAIGNAPNPADWTGSYNGVSSEATHNHTSGGTKGLLVNNNYGTGTHAITHEFGQTISATPSDPVHLDWWAKAPGTSRRRGDWIIELSMGDFHAPTHGTVLTDAIPVIAYAKPYNDAVYMSFFDGKQWTNLGDMIADTWHNGVVDIKSDGTADVELVGRASFTFALQYTGGFDRITVRYPGNAPAGAYWHVVDDINVTGVPEPAAFALVSIGLMFMRRRRTA